MATIGNQYITFRDINAGRLPSGQFDREIVEVIAKENPVLDDIVWKECNKGREDITTIRTGIPEAVFRAYYEGVQGTKGSKKQVANSCGTLSTAIEMEGRLYEDTQDKAQMLLDEVQIHADSMGQGAAAALFYGDIKDNPKGFNGLAKTFGAYAKTSSANDESAYYVLNGAKASNPSTSMCRSIFMVGWGQRSAHGIYPQGTGMGLRRGKLRDVYVPDPEDNTKKLLMYIQEMNWDIGLNIRDFRYCGRIANIEADAGLATSGQPDYVELIQRLTCRVKQNGVKPCLYMSRSVWEIVTTAFFRKTAGNAVKYGDLSQRLLPTLMGFPVGVCDALETNETAVPQAS